MWLKPEDFQFLKYQTKPKSVTIQLKALDKYLLMVLFVLLLKRVHFLLVFFWHRKIAVTGSDSVYRHTTGAQRVWCHRKCQVFAPRSSCDCDSALIRALLVIGYKLFFSFSLSINLR